MITVAIPSLDSTISVSSSCTMSISAAHIVCNSGNDLTNYLQLTQQKQQTCKASLKFTIPYLKADPSCVQREPFIGDIHSPLCGGKTFLTLQSTLFKSLIFSDGNEGSSLTPEKFALHEPESAVIDYDDDDGYVISENSNSSNRWTTTTVYSVKRKLSLTPSFIVSLPT